MRRGTTMKPSSYKGRNTMTRAQKLTKSNNPRYMSKKNDLTRRQKYKLEKMNLQNERAAVNAKQDTIRAIGSAFAQNFAPSTATAGFSIANNAYRDAKDKRDSTPINNLISGGSNKAGTSNDEEINEDVMPGGNQVR